MVALTPLRYEGTPCVKCGNSVRYKSNGNCVACMKRKFKENNTSYKSKQRVKNEVIQYYGGKCACCGESELIFLNIDHINQDGAEHRRKQPEASGGARFYYWLKKNNFPEGYRVLCFNCNFAIYHLGECPHSLPPQPRRDD